MFVGSRDMAQPVFKIASATPPAIVNGEDGEEAEEEEEVEEQQIDRTSSQSSLSSSCSTLEDSTSSAPKIASPSLLPPPKPDTQVGNTLSNSLLTLHSQRQKLQVLKHLHHPRL